MLPSLSRSALPILLPPLTDRTYYAIVLRLYTLRMRETPPAPDVLSSLFPAPSLSAWWGRAHGGDTTSAC
ncbi:hypothetical protein AB205_0132740 [Aquarana catesbeiana]|uniref:Uncharacterized protein n=1 Tax=Aquarana catesbeiana TaxID=8400 RepID=A0A2G9QN58_AQUCT|nr:hypothetical protein AB205_0132740 [Aquarana catesbeiana]